MDAFGSVGTSTSLVVQSFHLFRHISSARRFADNAGNLSGLIAIEYFRFETWLQQSGLLVVEPGSGTLVVTESSLRRAILLAADAQFMEYHRVENHVLTTLNQVYQCLLAIKKLRDKYSLKQADSGDNIRTSDLTDSTNLGLKVTTEIPGSVPLFQNTRVATEIVTDTNLRERRAKTMSFFRKVTFSWSLKDDSSDHNRITAHIQTLNSCNNTLRECLPPQQQHAADRLINVKALSLSDSPPELQGIGTAASTVHNNPLHDQIYQAMTVKAKRVGESSLGISPQDLQQGKLDSTTLTFNRDDTVVTTGISDRIMAQHKQSESQPPKTVILEWVIFHPSLPESDLDLLHERIALLCALLRSAGHPYFPALPLCSGFFRQSRTSFALVYQLPPFAAPSQPPRSLYSLLPRNKYSVVTEKRSTVILPSLEQRYELAAALADAVLSLLSVDWMHKTITSRNVVLYHQSSAAGGSQFQNRIGFSHPQLLGFGLARRERPAERTIDLRDGGLSPWRFWQHPELRSAGEQHRRFEQRFDIFSLGIVLFEIGMWQDAHYYSSPASSSSDSGKGEPSAASEFRRRLSHVCARDMAHRMGEAYKAAVMACLDGDEIWTGAAQLLGESDEDAMQVDGEGSGGANLAELFYLHVYSVLRGCCK